MPKKKSHEEFVADLLRINPTVTPLETYVNSSQPILCKCSICGQTWKVRPNNLLHGYGCPTCGLRQRAKTQTKGEDIFDQELKEIAPNLKLISEYKGARRYVTVKCVDCGNIWEALPTNLLKGRNCPECAKKIRADKNRRSEDEFQELLFTLHPNIKTLDDYQGNQKRIRYLCKTCGYVWKTSPSSVLSGHGCPRCAGNGVYSQEEFIKKVSLVNPQIEILGEYQRTKIPVLCRCKLCGNEWKAKPNSILSGRGCPKCFHSTTSFIEEAIFNALSIAAQGKTILKNDKKIIGKELDIVIPEQKIAIEPGSWKWHKPQIDKDLNKRLLCAQNGIRLITIYTDYPDENPPFSKDCYVYSQTIGFEQDLLILKEIISLLLNICNTPYCFSDAEWFDITRNAYLNSRRRTTDELKKQIENRQLMLDVEGEYTGAWNKIQVRCQKCGYVWKPIANNLIRGHGCPRCASKAKGKNLRKTEQEFLEEMGKLNPSIIILSSYETSNTYVLCECKQCGHQWKSLPSNLLKGKGCPICAKRKQGVNKRTDPEVFIKRLTEVNPNVELLSKYEKTSSKIKCRCKLCDHQWMANPRDLLAGRGCPKCAYRKIAVQKQKRVELVETGQVFDSIKEAAVFIGTTDRNLSACLRGKSKTAKGMHWKFTEAT